MATKYTAKDIIRIIKEAKASADNDDGEKQGNFTSDTTVDPFVGKKRNIIGIVPGFKLKHRETGLAYTVKEISESGNDVVVTAESGSGQVIYITSKNFKLYERM